MTDLTDKQLAALERCWIISEGKAWQPKAGTDNPYINAFVEAGFCKIVDGRCGFELIKDSMVAWTEAGRTVFSLKYK